MTFIKLDYNDYLKIRNIMEDLEDLDVSEKLTLAKVEGIVQLMEDKREQENAGVIPLPPRGYQMKSSRNAHIPITEPNGERAKEVSSLN